MEAPELSGLTPNEIVQLPREGYLSAVAVADEQTMRDGTISFLDLDEFGEESRAHLPCHPQEIEPITANLSIANMDFSDFADNTDADGIFRGFWRHPRNIRNCGPSCGPRSVRTRPRAREQRRSTVSVGRASSITAWG